MSSSHDLPPLTPEFRGALESGPLDLLQKLFLGVRSCTGRDRSCLLLYHSTSTSCSGMSAWDWLRETPPAALRDSVRWNLLYAVKRIRVQSPCTSKSPQSKEWLREEETVRCWSYYSG